VQNRHKKAICTTFGAAFGAANPSKTTASSHMWQEVSFRAPMSLRAIVVARATSQVGEAYFTASINE
jgi:hypothetical protein